VTTNVEKILAFVVITFSINFLLIILYLKTGNTWVPPKSYIISATYMIVPMSVSILVQKVIFQQNLTSLGINWNFNLWFVIAWFLPIFLAFTTFAISLLFSDIRYSPNFAGLLELLKNVTPAEELKQIQEDFAKVPVPIFLLTSVIQSLIAGVTINGILAFGEELGWRGLMQTELSFMGFWKTSLIIGLTWGVWHAPLILQGHNYPQHPKLGVFMMIFATLLLAPIFSYIRIKSNSVIAVSIMHGTINAIGQLPVALVQGGNDLTVGITGLSGLLANFLMILCLFIYDVYLVKEEIMLS
jgi:uncharacterized protein